MFERGVVFHIRFWCESLGLWVVCACRFPSQYEARDYAKASQKAGMPIWQIWRESQFLEMTHMVDGNRM